MLDANWSFVETIWALEPEIFLCMDTITNHAHVSAGNLIASMIYQMIYVITP